MKRYICSNFSKSDIQTAVKYDWTKHWEGIEEHPMLYMMRSWEKHDVYYLEKDEKSGRVTKIEKLT